MKHEVVSAHYHETTEKSEVKRNEIQWYFNGKPVRTISKISFIQEEINIKVEQTSKQSYYTTDSHAVQTRSDWDKEITQRVQTSVRKPSREC